jgi:hypothetical protein
MKMLTRYEDFLERVDELGFMALSYCLPGLPYLGEETSAQAWHTGNVETDPWKWKDRAAEEKRAAYGCILGGNKGFISARLYAAFYAACHPTEPMPERYSAGIVTQTVWQLWQLFETKSLLNTSDVRREMGVTQKNGGSRVDGAIQELQRTFYITTAGCRQKIGKDGQPYGWPASVYDRVSHWSPADWLKDAPGMTRREAKEIILEVGLSAGRDVQREDLTKLLGIV